MPTTDPQVRPAATPLDALGELIESRHARCVVVGLGFVGSTLADALAAAGFAVHGHDRDPAAAAAYLARSGGNRIASPADTVLADADVVVVAVRVPVRADGSVDDEPLRAVAAALRQHSRSPRLVVVASTVPPGCTRAFAGWLGDDGGCFVAHAPERLAAEHGWRDLRGIPHLVGGVDQASTQAAALLLGTFCDQVVPVSAPEVSELAKLLENTYRAVNIALVGEVTRIAHGFGVAAAEVCRAAATKPFGYHAFYPGPGAGGHCLPNDLQILRHAAALHGRPTPLLDGTATAAAIQPALVVDRVEALAGGTLHGRAVLLVGAGFKPGSADTTASPVRAVARLLRERGARPAYLDGRVECLEVDGEPVPRVSPDALGAETFAAAVVLAGDPALAAARLASIPVVLDAGGAHVLRGALAGMHTL
ncbi:MAG TPA: nucleotide sugar dehydrogenase [Longimicrobium sp.]|nr:nucleotide sugar dehydrogenase [Longimicrobium sp.]